MDLMRKQLVWNMLLVLWVNTLPNWGLGQSKDGRPQLSPISSDMSFYWDEGGDMTFAEVEALFDQGAFYQLDAAGFIKPGQKATNPGVYWASYRFVVDPTLQDVGELGFCILGDTSHFRIWYDEVDVFYRNKEDSLIVSRTGKTANTYKKDPNWRFSEACVPIKVVSPDTILLLIRLFGNQAYRNYLYGYQTSLIDEKNRVNQQIISQAPTIIFRIIFIGILLYFSLYSFIQYRQIGERAYLFYGIYLFTTFFYSAEHLEWDTDVFGIFSHITEWHFYYEVPLVCIIYLSYMSFIVSFLDLGKENKQAAWLLKMGMYVTIALLAIDIVTRQIGGTYLSMIFYKYDRYPLFLMAIPFVYHIYKVNQEKRHDPDYQAHRKLIIYIVTGSLFIAIGGLLTLLLKRTPLIDHQADSLFRHSITYTQLGLLVENTIFIVGLGYKTRLSALVLQQRVSAQTEKIDLLEENATRLMVDSHSMKNILQAIQGLVTTNPAEANKYLQKAMKLSEKWYSEASDKVTNKYQPLKEEITDMEIWVNLNNIVLKPKVQLTISGKDGLDDTFPPVAKRLLLPFVENAILHGLKKKEKGQRVLMIEVLFLDRVYKIVIEDNGIGRQAARDLVKGQYPTRASSGIQLAAELMEKYGITLDIEDLTLSGRPTGTRVTIEIPK